MSVPPSPSTALAVTIEEAMQWLPFGHCTIRKLAKRGDLETVKSPCGRKMLLSLWSVLRFAGVPADAATAVIVSRVGQVQAEPEPPAAATSRRDRQAATSPPARRGRPAGRGHADGEMSPQAKIGIRAYLKASGQSA